MKYDYCNSICFLYNMVLVGAGNLFRRSFELFNMHKKPCAVRSIHDMKGDRQ